MRDPSPTWPQVPLYMGVPCVVVPAINQMILTVVLGKACKRCGGDRKEVEIGSSHGEEFHNLYCLSNIINVIQSQRWDWQDR
jgi:hypothetical protein